jgi:SPP1 family predicted phage head-tail adaptor
MRAGKLDRTIVIERSEETIDAYGTPASVWSLVAILRAEIVQASTEEFIRNGAVDETAMVFRTRWLAGVTTADRITSEGVIFDVKETKELGRRRGLEIRCVRSA